MPHQHIGLGYLFVHCPLLLLRNFWRRFFFSDSHPDPWLCRGESWSGPGAASISLGAWPDVTLWLTRSCSIHRGRKRGYILFHCLFPSVPRLGTVTEAQLWPRCYAKGAVFLLASGHRLCEGCLFLHVSALKQLEAALVGYISGLAVSWPSLGYFSPSFCVTTVSFM